MATANPALVTPSRASSEEWSFSPNLVAIPALPDTTTLRTFAWNHDCAQVDARHVNRYADAMLLSFIWHYRGSVQAPKNVPASDLLDTLEGMLAGQHKKIATRGHECISFRVPVPLFSGGDRSDAMALFESGKFNVSGTANNSSPSVAFDLSCFWAFLFCLIPVAIGAVVSFTDMRQGANIAIVGFGWLYGINQILARIRVPRLIRRTLQRCATP